ncbi:DNA mismatch repair protein MutL [Laetiporus sulphureus 93-53]|uniref:DNA mismatch repair protein PMS1 n=1 Tax=Laetiporus sulphureus 93-53 TaxID=1314785 RepID=A0A165DL09_9APHY|nr:DNA mismatch repair protein MutL [Laetiporus sulphureus 93-53]KZT05115.1 DNA mismatch repair protein MutL [Laetiporus sulphureus 93-53]
MASPSSGAIKALDASSVHRISSGQVVIDLQTAVKELVENGLDAGATSIEVRFKDHGLDFIEVTDNGSGIAPQDYDAIALKHHTSKLSSFDDLTVLTTFGFRGEALSSLCALAEQVTVVTATAAESPMGTVIELDRAGRVSSRSGKVARQRGTTVSISGLFKPLPVRRKELERNAKREFGKALAWLSAYALIPCAQENRGVRLTVTHQPSGGKKSVQLRTDGTPSTRSSVSALWGPKALENLVELELCFAVETERSVLRRRRLIDGADHSSEVRVRGLVSKFSVGCGRTATDRQFFFINGRPCNPPKVQKAFNEVYRSFNANQAPFIVADFILPTDSCDVNVSPDKRTILLHSENNLVQALKAALEESFAASRATYDINPASSSVTSSPVVAKRGPERPIERGRLFSQDESDAVNKGEDGRPEEQRQSTGTGRSDNISKMNAGHDEAGFGEPLLLQNRQLSGSVATSAGDDATEDGRSSSFVEPPTLAGPGLEDDARPTSEGPRGREMVASSHVAAGQQSPLRSSQSSACAMTGANADSPDANECDRADKGSLAMTQLGAAVWESGSPSASQVDLPMSSHVESTQRVAAAESTSAGDELLTVSAPRKKRPADVADGSRTVQMVLNSTGVAWNLRHTAPDDDIPSSKRRKTSSPPRGKEGRNAREDLREKLRNFARTGSQIMDVDMDESITSMGGALVGESDQLGVHEQQGVVLYTENNDAAEDSCIEGRSEYGSEIAPHDQSGIPSSSSHSDVDVVNDSATAPESEAGISDPTISSPSDTTCASRPEIIRSADGEDVTFHFEIQHVSSRWSRLQDKVSGVGGSDTHVAISSVPQDAGITNADDDNVAAEALSRVISKADFTSMQIVGQFNLGFIIVRRRTSPSRSDSNDGNASAQAMDDLFIVDQHAADEKYNFETLQWTTKIDSQKLFRPQPLELTAADELLAAENMDVLRQNGFEIDTNEDVLSGESQHRLQLVAQPTSKSTVFDIKDLEELLHLMHDRPAGQMVRCSKARSMFAMRACRKSVMVGMPLSRSQMASIIRHMGTMDQPWNCPHGRPTMRHLSDIATFGRGRRQDRHGDVDWANFGS